MPISVRLFKGASAVLAGLGVYLLVGCAPTPPLNSGSHEPSTASVPIRAPYQTVSQEHHDRIRRLKRLVDARSDITMHTESVDPQEHGLSNYPVDIPVLRVVFDREVFFDVDEAAVKNQAREVLDIVAEDLKHEPPDVALFVAGHTDATGSENYNFNLGLRRAESVAAALVRRGVYQADVYRVSFGEHMPVATNNTTRGRAKNRRVEFLFAPQPEAIVAWLQKQSAESCSARTSQNLSRCKKDLKVTAQVVDVPKEYEPQVRELARKSQNVDSGREASDVNSSRETEEAVTERSQTVVELEREKIPVKLGRKKYSIELRRTK